MASIIIRVLINAVALWVATLLPGITLGGATALEKVGTLLAVAVIFGVVNGILKPVIKSARPRNDARVDGSSLRAALDKVLAGLPYRSRTRRVWACGIKWKPGNEPE